jgi:DNA repair exonuclease SbcCD ATPase subunit
MKVAKLHLENFRIHKDSVLSFGDSSFVVIRGRNAAGKSTIGQGLSMCLTPSTSGLDPRGQGFISKIKRGASKAILTADLQTKHHLIQRTVTLNTSASGRTQKTVCLSDPTWKPTRFDQELEKQRAALTVVLNTDAFLRMDEKEQKNLLASLALPSRYDFAPLVVAEVETILGRGTVNFEGEPFAAINQAYKKLFDERQIVNRQVKEFAIPDELPIPPDVDSASIQDQLASLRARRRELQQERDQAVAVANKEELSRVRAKERIDEALNAEQRRRKAISDRLLKDGQLEYLRKVAAGKPELDRLVAERAACVRTREHNVTQLKGLEGIPWGAKACPTCEQPVDPEKLKALGEKLKGWVRDTETSLGMMDQKIKALGDVAGAVEAIAVHEEARKKLEEFDAQSDQRQKQIDEARKDVPGPTHFDFSPFNESMGDCDTEIERLSNLLRPVIVAEERRKEVEVKRGQLAALKEKAMVLDQLVKYFDKDGIKAKLLGEYI